MKVMTIMGTRPEMIKMWSVLKKLDELNFDHIMVHTSQNHTKELKDFFFRDLELRKPDYDLQIDTSCYGNEVADVIKKSDELFEKVKPDALIILGDTYSGLSVMPASNRGIKIFHMEAGLRAWDKRMPEQRNRILIDHISDILLPFNQYHRENLIREDIHPSKIFVTGNPTFEVMRAFQDKIAASRILETLKLEPKKYVAVTAHRKENVDDPVIFQSILDGLALINKKFRIEVVYPMHPRAKSKLKGRTIGKGIRIIDPMGFYDFNCFNKNAFCLVADSGTTPEEGLFYKVPCVSIRQSTERPETVEAGAHIVAGNDPVSICESVETAVTMKWTGNYDLCEDCSPSSVVINILRSCITNHF
ncbi:MAG: UDP-N-acetylglucosamine 2-epimerase (non-hydrolyzing) [Candidatus Omnitrophota bacterium]